MMDKFVLKTGTTSGSAPKIGLDMALRAACPVPGITTSSGTFELFTLDSNTIDLDGNGTVGNPLTAHLIISPQPGNILQALSDGAYVPPTFVNGYAGGEVTWTGSGYIYDVAPVSYNLNGDTFDILTTSQITLATSDPLFDRIDTVAVDDNGQVVVITGIPAEDPVKPQVDPTSQLELTTIYVTANTLEPVIDIETIYDENAGPEWDGSVSGTTGNFADTSNAQNGTINADITNINNLDTITFTKDSGTFSLVGQDSLNFYILLKAVMPSTANLRVSFWNGGTQVSSEVTVPIDKNNSTTYQNFAIPISAFVITNYNVDKLVFRYTNTTAVVHSGFYMDNIYIQAGQEVPSGNYILNQLSTPQPANYWISNLGRAGQFEPTDSDPPVNGMYLPEANVVGIATNSANSLRIYHTSNVLNPRGNIWLDKSTQPTISFFTGTFTSSDYFIQRSGTTMTYNSAGEHAIHISGRNGYNINANANRGHEWKSMTTPTNNNLMQLFPNGSLLLMTTTAAQTPDASAIFEADSTTRGVLFPRMTTTQKNAIASPTTGLWVYDTSLNTFYWYNGSAWVTFGTGSGTLTDANNGLSVSGGTTVQLGGSELLGDTSITTSAFALTIPSSSSNNTLRVVNTGIGTGIHVDVTGGSGSGIVSLGTSGFGVYGSATSGVGMQGYSATGVGIFGQSDGSYASTFRRFDATNDSVISVTSIERYPNSGAGAIGMGGALDFRLKPATGSTSLLSNQIISKWTDPTNATITSQMHFTGANAGSVNTMLILNGNGSVTFPDYGVGTFVDTPEFSLGVTPTGEVIEFSPVSEAFSIAMAIVL